MAIRKRLLAAAIVCAGWAVAAGAAAAPAAAQVRSEPAAAWAAEDEVFYQIFVRSFRDANGDGVGDLRGIRQSLGYLQDLGVTSILLTPINPSPFYHNYFASSFEGVDPAYGDAGALRELVAAVHARGMKIYLDEEVQYLAGGHPWWVQSEGKPSSQFSRYLIYRGAGNTMPDTAAFHLLEAPGYAGEPIRLTTVNLLEPAVQHYFQRLFLALVDPNGDGRFDDGVDGFRLDHMMDDLDNRGELKDLFARFWAPIFASVRAVNPRVRWIAEQGDWGSGEDYLRRGGADMVFAFPLRSAIVSFKREAIADALRRMVELTPPGKGRLIFIENHDVTRFATEVGGDPRKERIGAAFDILLKGTPLIYYGQEIGMKGRQMPAWSWGAMDIPLREAFRWRSRVEAPGSATWYHGAHPWWTGRFARDHDGISVEEEQRDPNSLLTFYRHLLSLRRSRAELRSGDERVLATAQKDVLAVIRSQGEQASLLLVNLADAPATVAIERGALPANFAGTLRSLISGKSSASAAAPLRVKLEPFGLELLAPALLRRVRR